MKSVYKIMNDTQKTSIITTYFINPRVEIIYILTNDGYFL